MLAVIVLAAGGGTRMKSSLPKVLHPVCGKPMLSHVLDTAGKLNPDKLIVVLGHEIDVVQKTLCDGDFDIAEQVEQLGTAHAVMQAQKKLEGFEGDIVILYGDTPLIKSSTIENLINKRQEEMSAAVIATTELECPTGYGRIIRDASGKIKTIIEEKDADENEKLVKEINTGIYCFDSKYLFENLSNVSCNNSQKEYYLTDVVSFLVSQGKKTSILKIECDEATGINSRQDLAFVNNTYRNTINNRLMTEGVTIEDPENTYIDSDVKIYPDSVISPGTTIKGKTTIKSSCHIGPNSYIESCEIDEGSNIISSYLTEAKIGKNAVIGPFSHLRPGTIIGEDAKVGAFSEVKKTTVGKNSKVPHLSYIGDSEIGDDVNIGAGTITCNYDGKNKYKTIIEDGAFIGSDTMLVAPIKVGKGAYTGAGSALTEDVPNDSLAIERSKQKTIKDWAKKKRGS